MQKALSRESSQKTKTIGNEKQRNKSGPVIRADQKKDTVITMKFRKWTAGTQWFFCIISCRLHRANLLRLIPKSIQFSIVICCLSRFLRASSASFLTLFRGKDYNRNRLCQTNNVNVTHSVNYGFSMIRKILWNSFFTVIMPHYAVLSEEKQIFLEVKGYADNLNITVPRYCIMRYISFSEFHPSFSLKWRLFGWQRLRYFVFKSLLRNVEFTNFTEN